MQQLQKEYETEIVGARLYAEVVRAVRGAIKNYDPKKYGGVADWTDAWEDVVQGVVTSRLLGERQIDYVMDRAHTVAEVRMLLAEQVRRYLAKARVLTVVDQLLKRLQPIAGEPPFQVYARRRNRISSFHLIRTQVDEERVASDREVAEATRAASLFPIQFGRGGNVRAPAVYATETLEGLARAVCAEIGCPVQMTTMDRIFNSLLTDWVVGDLGYIDGQLSVETEALDPAREVAAVMAARAVVTDLAARDRVILRGALLGVRDAEVAKDLRISRQTVISRRQRIVERAGAMFDDADPCVTRVFMDELHCLVGGHHNE